MIVLSVGKTYADIDGYASSIAYRELLKMKGIDAKFVSTATLNYSITEEFLNIPFQMDKYLPKKDDSYIILDLSNKAFFPEFIKEKNIIEIVDHHSGFEKEWAKKRKIRTQIEPIGAVATIIVERYIQEHLLEKMDKAIARLLMAAILDNTLNFTAKITKDRDKEAYRKLQEITTEDQFARSYFLDCQRKIEEDLKSAIENDLKMLPESKYLPRAIGQLTVWDVEKLKDRIEEIRQLMNQTGNSWMVNIISLEKNLSYIICSDDRVINHLRVFLKGALDGDILIVRPSLLRKEIMKLSQNEEFNEGGEDND